MNKEEFQIGDLVRLNRNIFDFNGVGLVTAIIPHTIWPYEVYWFGEETRSAYDPAALAKLEIPNE
jgi:hypothetical protein